MIPKLEIIHAGWSSKDVVKRNEWSPISCKRLSLMELMDIILKMSMAKEGRGDEESSISHVKGKNAVLSNTRQ